MIKKSKDPTEALLDYRNTPLEGVMLSPAQLHIGRRLKSSSPTTEALLKTQRHSDMIKKKLKTRQEKQRFYYDKKAGKPLPSVKQEESVMIKHNKQMVPGKVIKYHDKPRSYILETNKGQV